MRLITLVCATIYASGLFTQAFAQAPMNRVVVTLAPILPLVAEIMQGGGTPKGLNAGGDAHTMIVTPTMTQALAEAKVIIIDDRGTNPGLMHMISKYAAKGATIIALTELEGASPRPYGKVNSYTNDVVLVKDKTKWMKSAFDTRDPPKERLDGGGLDPHVWLDPIRMSRMMPALAEKLGEIDPGHAETYRYNARVLSDHLVEQVDPQIRGLISRATPSTKEQVIPFITYHDAFRYFGARYGLDSIGYITQRPEEYIGAASMKKLMEASETVKVGCIISDNRNTMTQNIARRTEARIVILNPERIYAGKDAPSVAWATNDYDRLLAKTAYVFADCIRGKKERK